MEYTSEQYQIIAASIAGPLFGFYLVSKGEELFRFGRKVVKTAVNNVLFGERHRGRDITQNLN